VSTPLFVKKLKYFLEQLGISKADLCRLLSHNTRLMDYSLEKTIVPRVQFFQEYFGTDDLTAIGKYVVRSPRMLWVCSCCLTSLLRLVIEKCLPLRGVQHYLVNPATNVPSILDRSTQRE
jgi:hypothetical protein